MLPVGGQLAAKPLEADEGLLWRVEAPSGAFSHLMGTIHVAEPAILQLPLPVQSAFNQLQQLVVEVVLQPADYLEIADRMKLTGGQRLPTLIGESSARRTSRGINQQLMRLKPWAVATKLVTPRPTRLPVLDQQLERDAVTAGKRVIGLETLDEQLVVLEQMSVDEQVEFLHEVVLATLYFDVYYGELLAANMNRDLARLMQSSRSNLVQSRWIIEA